MQAGRRADTTRTLEDLRQLGPALEADPVLLTVDEVLTPKPAAHQFWELRTARIVTPEGYRELSGVGETFLQHLFVVVLLGLRVSRSLLLIADGARWIQTVFAKTLACISDKIMLLDWYHLAQKCLEASSRICRGKVARAQFLRRLYRRLTISTDVARVVCSAWCTSCSSLRRIDRRSTIEASREDVLYVEHSAGH